MHEWLSHDFIDNCNPLKSFSAKQNAIFDYKQNKKANKRKTIFLQKLHRWISAFSTHIDLCVVHLYFLHGMDLQFSTIAVRMHFFIFYMYMRIYAYFGARVMSIGVELVLGTERTLKRNLSLGLFQYKIR